MQQALVEIQDKKSAYLGIDQTIREALEVNGWFEVPGAYILVDGQYGSTGKGLFASVLAEAGSRFITHVTTNAGPNSGHTAYIPDLTVNSSNFSGRIMTQQIPIGSLFCAPVSYLNAGAIIDPDILYSEIENIGLGLNLVIHPSAAIIRKEDRETEKNWHFHSSTSFGPSKIASTNKGVGAALASKIMRECNTAEFYMNSLPGTVKAIQWDWKKDCVFVETAQGFSLGLNSRFYPYVTSRECTVMQAIADAHIPCKMVRKIAASFRTYPIRVGNTLVGNSGACYPDQIEIQWEDIGQEPELTSVTKRVRRLFTWSRQQFKECIAVNRPDLLFLNFANYMDTPKLSRLINQMRIDYKEIIGDWPELILVGFGPTNDSVQLWG